MEKMIDLKKKKKKGWSDIEPKPNILNLIFFIDEMVQKSS